MAYRWLPILFPKTPRNFSGRRFVRMTLRGLHLLSAGTLIGGHVFNQPDTLLEPWLYPAVISGSLILMTDIYASMVVLFELRGVLVLLKIGLLLLVPVFESMSILLLVTILMIGVFGSHMQKHYRHKVLLLNNYLTPDEING